MSILGKLIYSLYYEPRGKRAFIRKFGGKQNYAAMLAAEREMRVYALNDLEIDGNFNSNGRFKINFLTGDQFIHQTLFCTYSFFKFLSPAESADFSVNYYSDGTLSDAVIMTLNARFPHIKLISLEESKALAKECLPKSEFPWLNKKMETLPLFKKLLFPHLNNSGGSTFFDSDMLFLERPEAFLNWLYQYGSLQNHAFCILDTQRYYGYTDEQILKIWPLGLKHNINSGMYSIFSELVDFNFIENLVTEFERHYGSQYFMEQLITAVLLEKTENLFIAPPADYIVLPSPEQVRYQSGTLHHYVNQSKELYFKESWRSQLAHT